MIVLSSPLICFVRGPPAMGGSPFRLVFWGRLHGQKRSEQPPGTGLNGLLPCTRRVCGSAGCGTIWNRTEAWAIGFAPAAAIRANNPPVGGSHFADGHGRAPDHVIRCKAQILLPSGSRK